MENKDRQIWLEKWIYDQPDGLLHTVPQDMSKPPPKHPGVESSYGADEADICLNCPKQVCELDIKRFCRRLAKIKQERSKRT